MATASAVSSAAKKSGRKNTIGGFLTDKVNGDIMRAYAKRHRIDVDTDVDDEQLAMALVLHFRETVKKDDQVECSTCKGVSSINDSECPLCGAEGDDDEEEAEDIVETTASEESDDADEESVDDTDDEDDTDDAEDEDTDDDNDVEDEDTEDDAEDDDAEDEDTDDGDDVEDEDTEDDDDADGDDPPATGTLAEAAKLEDEAPEPKPTEPATKGNNENANMSTAMVNGSGSKKATNNVTSITRASSGEKSAKDLDKAVAEVQRLKSSSMSSYYELCQRVARINKDALWKLRKDDDGKLAYKSFDQFVHHELSMTSTHAYNLIDCAKNYKNAGEIAEVGGKTNAILVLKAAPQDREKVRDKAKAGATKRELEKEVAESRKKNGPAKQSQQAKAASKGAKAKVAKTAKKAERITVASIVGSRKVKMYAKPESMRGLVWPPKDRAKTIGDQPFARLELQAGVTQYFTVVKGEDGQLALHIQTVREGE